MTSYPAVEAIAATHVHAAIAAGAEIDPPPGVTVVARDDAVALSGRGLGERWNTDARLRGLADAVRAAAR